MKLTPTQAGRAYIIRTFGEFLVTMSPMAQKQLIAAYVAGVRHAERRRNGK